jgi:catechol 2,3-dioxygenase-like lactoylglutathione lyase family enzyme
MKVWRLCWLGVRTERYAETVELFRDVLGLTVEFEEPTTTELALPNGDRVQVFGPGHRYDAFFEEHARGPVALFEVDDVHAARRELEAAGVEVIGAVERDSKWEWISFRGPDGNLYELASPGR